MVTPVISPVHTEERKDISDEKLMRLMETAMRNSLRDGIDPRDTHLIPASESFKGLFF